MSANNIGLTSNTDICILHFKIALLPLNILPLGLKKSVLYSASTEFLIRDHRICISTWFHSNYTSLCQNKHPYQGPQKQVKGIAFRFFITLYFIDTHFDKGQLLKTLWEKEKLLVMINFSISHNFPQFSLLNQIIVSLFVISKSF